MFGGVGHRDGAKSLLRDAKAGVGAVGANVGWSSSRPDSGRGGVSDGSQESWPSKHGKAAPHPNRDSIEEYEVRCPAKLRSSGRSDQIPHGPVP